MVRSTVAALLLVSLPSPGGPVFEPGVDEVRQCHAALAEFEGRTTRPPNDLVDIINTHLDDERLDGAALGLSLWIEGYGELAESHSTLRLRPASNQKILTAMGALELLGPEATLTTTLAASTPPSGDTIDGDLVLIGGGDPSLSATGPSSLESMASAVAARGVTRVTGDLVVDESRYDTVRRHQSWSLFVAPQWVGSLSALMVDENRWSAEASFLADPARHNGELFEQSLAAAGVTVEGTVRVDATPNDVVILATSESPPIRALVAEMLTESNNTYAEMLVKEIGLVVTGTGSTQAGLRAIEEALRPWCLDPGILQNDGSGLSNGNFRAVRSWRLLLSAAHGADWWPEFEQGLAIAGETGTLRWRFRDTAAQGNLLAKTGTISGVRALSGVMETADGREVVFSAIIHDRDQPRRAFTAIDDLLVALANWPVPPEPEPES